uniref:Conserved hypothetical plastid protein n=1 Tax=Caulacanthus okamurae TaxID=152008 RepID=A0A6H1U747_9FLOR|nr:conserved hypothetical plastid protein [Caulacanthus okamurae]QIZ74718.1 conserved hypothetical plastid protein [Caulacanthus okamurae]
MIEPLKKLIHYLEGKWICQQTIYDFTNKIININQDKINYLTLKKIDKAELINCSYICQYSNNKKIVYKYVNSNNYYPVQGTIKKLDQNIITNYFFKLENENLLKIEYLNNNIKYTEYVYFLHKNFKLSIILLKTIKYYNAVCFMSSIKIN